jgi:hypothetical protein
MAIIKPEQLSSGSYNISGSFSGSFAGDGSNLTNLPNQSFNTGSFVTTSSFNAFTGSYNTGSFTGSFIGNGSGLTNLPTLSFNTSSLATTGSNTFVGNQIVTGSVTSTTGFTGSLFGIATTSSYVLNAVSASYSVTASFATSALTASFSLTSPLGKKITQSSTTLINQYQAPAGLTNTMVFSASIISTPGQIIDVDFLARNNSGLSTALRVYVNSSATTAGATQIGNFTIDPTTDLMVRFTHRFVVVRDSLRTNNWFLIGSDALGYNTDIVYGAGEYFTETALGSATLLEKPFIIATLNQSGSLIAASINY